MFFSDHQRRLFFDSLSHWLSRLRAARQRLLAGLLISLMVGAAVSTSLAEPSARLSERPRPAPQPASCQPRPLSLEALQALWSDPRKATPALIKQFSHREKLGQLLMLDCRLWSAAAAERPQPMTTLPPTVADLINRYAIGSVILFRDNCLTIPQLHQFNNQLQASRRRLPLLIGIDQEGGGVQRLPMATQLPGNMALGATGHPPWAKAAGVLTGQELRALGFNINFAPVIDVNTHHNNPVIGVRAFGGQPELVATMAQAYLEGVQQSGLLAIAKHFPGHGNTAVDSHSALPIIPYSLKQWAAVDRPPFEQVIRSGVAGIMSAHVAVPALDNTRVLSKKTGLEIPLPATLSRKIIQGQLRCSLRYEGLIVSDALCMKAVSEHFGTLEAVKKALLAGIDIVMMPLSVQNPSEITALEALLSALEKEMICNPRFKQRIDEAVHRVVFTKLRQQLSPQLPDLTEALATVGSVAHQRLAQRIAQQAVTLIKNDGVLPVDCRTQPRLLWISNSAASHQVVEQAIQRINVQIAPAAIGLQTTLVAWSASQLPPGFEQQLATVDRVILMTTDLRGPSAAAQQLLNQAEQQKKPVIVVAANSPYDVAYLDSTKVGAMVAIYGHKSFDPTDPSLLKQLTINLEAGIMTLFTDPQQPARFNRPSGQLPVAIQAAVRGACSYPIGHGLRYP